MDYHLLASGPLDILKAHRSDAANRSGKSRFDRIPQKSWVDLLRMTECVPQASRKDTRQPRLSGWPGCYVTSQPKRPADNLRNFAHGNILGFNAGVSEVLLSSSDEQAPGLYEPICLGEAADGRVAPAQRSVPRRRRCDWPQRPA